MPKKLSTDYRLPFALRSDGSISTIRAGNISPIYWPDGRWCFAANAFLLQMVLHNKSTFGGGGTIVTYASQLRHFVRYCYSIDADFSDITDNDFTDFVFSLGGDCRNSSTVLQIARLALTFLEFVGNLLDDDTFVGVNGRIKAEKKWRFDRRTDRTSLVWRHRSFPNASRANQRRPISGPAIEALRVAAVESSSSIHLQKRRLIMILLLECSGCRRSELVGVRVTDVKRALTLAQPMLSVPSIKKGGNRQERREVPVARSDLEIIDQFIEVNRRALIRQTCGRAQDSGHLLISVRTGRPLSGNHITREIWRLARWAKLDSKASPHLFRHRFVTKIFFAMREYRSFKSADAFARALHSDLAFQRQMLQWTGHKSVHSFEGYIDVTFEEAEARAFVQQHPSFR